MKKFINEVDQIVEDTITGFVSAHEHKIQKVQGANVVARREMTKGKVGVIIGNGSGHEPACIGFVGKNMLDCNAFGGLFAAPGPDTILRAMKEADQGEGVVVLISNHAGDIINSKIALQWAAEDGIQAQGVVLYDDIASAGPENMEERRGTAGTFFNYKITGSFAEEAENIHEVVKMAEKVRDNTRTLTVASIPGVSPITGEPMFEIAEDKVEIGIGVHGEAAAATMKMTSARAIARTMVEKLVADKPYQEGDQVIVLVNGCGQTTYMELLIFYKEVGAYLDEKGITVFKPAIGSFITTQEMGGIALSFCKVDEQMKKMWEKETDAPCFPRL